MAYVSKQTVTGHDALLTALTTFLSTDTTLVAAGQEWTVLGDTTVGAERFVYLKGPGLAGDDEIYVGIRRFLDLTTNAYNWAIIGMTGYDSGLSFTNQPGASYESYLCLANLAGMEYWIIANGRRFILIVKIGSVFVSTYCGLILPYATPSEYPYPLFIGGTSFLSGALYTDAGILTTAFWKGGQGMNAIDHRGPNMLRLISGYWLPMLQDRVYFNESTRFGRIWPYWKTDGPSLDNGIGDLDVVGTSDYPIVEVILYTNTYDLGNVYGSFDGVYHVPGTGLSSEDTLTIGADTYIVFQNVEDVGRNDFAALKLE